MDAGDLMDIGPLVPPLDGWIEEPVPVEFVDIPTSGRVHRESRSVRLGDVDGRNEMHLEALGRFLQDAAADDVSDSGLPERGVWVVRRYDIELAVSPGFRDVLDLATFCSGTGP